MRTALLWPIKAGIYGALVLLSSLSVASSASAACPNAAIREQQGATYLPDCMAFEMVSPSDKQGAYAYTPGISASGDRVSFRARAALGETPAYLEPIVGDTYISSRGPTGWNVSSTAPPASLGFSPQSAFVKALAPDFGHWLSTQATGNQAVLGQWTVFEAGLDGVWSPRSRLLVPQGGLIDHGVRDDAIAFESASEDFSHLVLRPGLPENSSLVAAYLPGDPRPTKPLARNLYVLASDSSGLPTIALLTRDSTGKVWGGNCGGWIGGGLADFNKRGGRNRGAISADGARIYFSTQPAQPQANLGEPGLPACNTSSATNPIRIMQRLESAAGVQIEELFSSECTRVSPACDLTNGDDFYEGASLDQARVYFTSSRQLTDSDLDTGTQCAPTLAASQGCDLYLYDSTKPVGHRLTQVSAGEVTAAHPAAGSGAGVVRGVTAISGDGSRAYFVASGVLTEHTSPAGTVAVDGRPNLYVYDAETGQIAFVGTLASNDNLFGSASNNDYNAANAVPMLGRNAEGSEVGGDGHVLVFISSASLTADDTDGGRADVFRYDAERQTLQRVSKAAPGGSDNGDFGVLNSDSDNDVPQTEFAEVNRFASEDGRSIAFITDEALAPGGIAGIRSPYLWREEGGSSRLVQLPASIPAENGTAPTSLRKPVVSHDGGEVAFVTTRPLVPSDGDSAEDVYVARADGGFPNPPLSEACQGEDCQGPPTLSPSLPNGASSTFVGKGNLQPRRACPKGKVRRKGKCVKGPARSRTHRTNHSRRHAK